jgi:hypothetical protein
MTLHKVYVFIPQLESKMATWFIQVQMDLLRCKKSDGYNTKCTMTL